jgi:hypothetical protein
MRAIFSLILVCLFYFSGPLYAFKNTMVEKNDRAYNITMTYYPDKENLFHFVLPARYKNENILEDKYSSNSGRGYTIINFHKAHENINHYSELLRLHAQCGPISADSYLTTFAKGIQEHAHNKSVKILERNTKRNNKGCEDSTLAIMIDNHIVYLHYYSVPGKVAGIQYERDLQRNMRPEDELEDMKKHISQISELKSIR